MERTFVSTDLRFTIETRRWLRGIAAGLAVSSFTALTYAQTAPPASSAAAPAPASSTAAPAPAGSTAAPTASFEATVTAPETAAPQPIATSPGAPDAAAPQAAGTETPSTELAAGATPVGAAPTAAAQPVATETSEKPAEEAVALPSRAERPFALTGSLGWNSLAGLALGGTFSFVPQV